jgi:hypothetical protein
MCDIDPEDEEERDEMAEDVRRAGKEGDGIVRRIEGDGCEVESRTRGFPVVERDKRVWDDGWTSRG